MRAAYLVSPEVADWAERRPAPACRRAAELAQLDAGIEWLRSSDDPRVKTLGAGAHAALAWVRGVTDTAPLAEIGCAFPNMREISELCGLAAAGAAGEFGPPGGEPCDAWRIYSRGVEDCLLWWSTPIYPLPVWGIAGLPPDLLVPIVIGDVGADRRTALQRVSEAEFPYEPADRLHTVVPDVLSRKAPAER